MLNPRQRQTLLHTLKKGPDFKDRQMLADFAVHEYGAITGKDLAAMVTRKLARWKEDQQNGPISANFTFLY